MFFFFPLLFHLFFCLRFLITSLFIIYFYFGLCDVLFRSLLYCFILSTRHFLSLMLFLSLVLFPSFFHFCYISFRLYFSFVLYCSSLPSIHCSDPYVFVLSFPFQLFFCVFTFSKFTVRILMFWSFHFIFSFSFPCCIVQVFLYTINNPSCLLFFSYMY